MTASIDPALVSRAVQCDRDAIAALLTQVRPGLMRYCRARLGRIGGFYTTADDVVQDVCLAVLRALPCYRDRGRPFTAFVYGIAANKIADAQRAALRHLARNDHDLPPDRPDGAPGPEQQALAADLIRRLSELLDRLPGVQREIVLLRVAVGLPAEEVGAIVGMSAAAVRVVQARALVRLRVFAGDAFDEVAAA